MKEDTLLGVIQKVRTVRFRNFRRPSPLYLHIRCSLPFSTSVRIVFFKEDMTKIYLANYYKSKNLKKRYKIKKQLHKAIGKCQIKTPTRALGTSLRFLTVQGRWEWHSSSPPFQAYVLYG